MIETLQLAVLVVGLALSLVFKRPVRCEVVDVVVSTSTVKGAYYEALENGQAQVAPVVPSGFGSASL